MFRSKQKVESGTAPTLRVLDDSEVVAVSGGTATQTPPQPTVGIGMGKGMDDPAPQPTATGKRHHLPFVG